MDQLLELANQFREDVRKRAIAHEKSSEWHRHRGVLLGGLATGLSALVSTSVFATYANQLRLGPSDLAKLEPFKSFGILFVVGLVLVLSSVITGVQAYLRHPEQAATHRDSYVRYHRLQQRLDIFCLKYADPNSDRTKCLEELDGISKDIQDVAASSITLTKRALAQKEPWWKSLWNALRRPPSPA